MDEDNSLWYVAFAGVVLTFIFIISLNRSTGLGIDFGTALFHVLGAIVAIILTGVGFSVLTYVLSVCAQSGAKNLGALFLLIKEKREWSEEIDAFKDESQKQDYSTKDTLDHHSSELKRNSKNNDFLHKNILEIREFIGIDAKKAEEQARAEILRDDQ